MEEVDGFFTVKLERFNLRGVKNELDRERKNAKISWRVTTKSNKKRMQLPRTSLHPYPHGRMPLACFRCCRTKYKLLTEHS